MEHKKILIIDDDMTLRDMYSHALTVAGFEVLMAENGTSGIRNALDTHPDLILVDVEMPDMNGHEVVNTVRGDAWGAKVPIVYLSNIDSPESVIYAVERGCEKYLVKANTTPSEVIKEIQKIVG